LFWFAVTAGGLSSAVWSLSYWSSADFGLFLTYVTIATAAACWRLKIPGVTPVLSLHFLFLLLSISQLSLPETMVIALAGAVLQYPLFAQKMRPSEFLFELAVATLATAGTYLFHADLVVHSGRASPLALAASASILFLLTTAPGYFLARLNGGVGVLQGWRDVPPADVAAITGVLTAISQLLADEPRIAEIDINPLLADADGVVALDARVVVSAAAPGGADNFAIRPYPSGLVETVQWHGREITLRPIRPEDEAQHLAFLEKLDPVDVRMRVFYSRRSIERSELARLTQIDYEREMAFIATAPSPEGEETLGVVRATSDPDNRDAEFGIIVRSDLKGSGLGERLMRKLIEYLHAKGTQRLVAQVLRENTRMLELARRLGFTIDPDQPDPRMCAISLRLQ